MLEEKIYTNEIIYKNVGDKDIMQKRVNSNIIFAILWLGASVLTHFEIHPYATIIPLWFFAGPMA